MNSNPSFYPKHLARKYVQEWNQAVEDIPPSLQVPPASRVPKINGQRSVSPVGNSSTSVMASNSTESSPSSMNSSEMSNISLRSNRKILEGLPDTFIAAMKQLFCLLDIDGCGQVHIEG